MYNLLQAPKDDLEWLLHVDIASFFENIKFQGESVWKRVLWVVENVNFQIWKSVGKKVF